MTQDMAAAGRSMDGLSECPFVFLCYPPHPGEFITSVYLEPFGVSGRELSYRLDVAPSTLSRVLKGQSRVTPDMARRLSKALGRSPESWLAMQDAHDLWLARQSTYLARISKLQLATIEKTKGHSLCFPLLCHQIVNDARHGSRGSINGWAE